MTWFQRLLLLTIALTFVLVVVGGTVRATDSGLGCPDWPACHGSLVPKLEKHTLIEYSHRTVAALVGAVFLGVTWFAFKTERRNTAVFRLAFSAGLLLAAQIVLGGITVKRELPPEIVALHLATAMAFLGVLIVTAIASLAASRGRAVTSVAAATPYARLAAAAALVAFATLVLGSYISGTDASLACGGWPLCDGALLPAGGDAGLHMLHRLLAGTLGVLLLGLIYAALDTRRRHAIALTCFAGSAFLAQAIVGAANIWTDLAAGVVVAHLSLAALLWCALVVATALALYQPAEESLPLHAVERGPGGEVTWAR